MKTVSLETKFYLQLAGFICIALRGDTVEAWHPTRGTKRWPLDVVTRMSAQGEPV